MSNIKDFKEIANKAMREINAGEELKKKTLMRYREKKNVPLNRVLVTAACFVLILGALNTAGFLSSGTQLREGKNTENIMMAATGEEMATLTGNPENNPLPESGTMKEWQPATPDEAKKDFGNTFAAPSYVPESFRLEKIYASGGEEHKATKMVLTYFAGDKSFLIIEERAEMQNGFVNFKAVEINGIPGYLKASASGDGENTDNVDTEVHWFKEGVHYSVTGQITEDEAVKIAVSMK